MQLRLWWFVKARDEREREKNSSSSREIHQCANAFFCYLSISFASASRTSSANDVSLTPPTTPGREAHRTHHGPKNDATTKKRALSVVVLIIFLVVKASSSSSSSSFSSISMVVLELCDNKVVFFLCVVFLCSKKK